MKTALTLALCTAISAFLITAPTTASGNLETFDITAMVPGPFPGTVVAPMVDMKWDQRCISVPYSVNTTIDPIPNPTGGPDLPLADAALAFQEAFDAWNDITTSFIDMQVVGATSNPGERGFDMVNELTFTTPVGFPAIASSPSVTLISDSVFVDGDDIDGDGDSDVSALLTECGDADGDGDFEFPEGFYPAGTILDNDVQYNADILGFTVGDASLNTDFNSVDLAVVATHEFGHSHGIAHTAINQVSETDGSGSTMFPSIDTSDPVDQVNGRSLHVDDIAYSSLYYPEGTGEGVAGLGGMGDQRFGRQFSAIRGTVKDPLGTPVIGASVFVEIPNTELRAGTTLATGITGRGQLGFDLASGGLFLLDPADSFIDDGYVVPVPNGRYRVGVEALDGFPVAGTQVNFTAIIGFLQGSQNFQEEYWGGSRFEGAVEPRTGPGATVVARFPAPGGVGGVDFVTNANVAISNVNNFDFFGLAALDAYYAARVPLSQLQALDNGAGISVQAMTFLTTTADASDVPEFEAAYLAAGVDNGDGTASIDLVSPLASHVPYVGQPADDGPVHFRNPRNLGRRALGFLASTGQELFLVLKVRANPLPGVSGFPPAIGLDLIDASLGEVGFGTSYISTDGGATFQNLTTVNLPFNLVVAPLPGAP